MKTTILFICTGNMDRSPTAKALCQQYTNIEAFAAGTSMYAKTPVTEEMVRAADALVVMEQGHAEFISERYPEAVQGKSVHCLDIPDEYQCMDAELVRLLTEKLKPILENATYQFHIQTT